MSIVVFLLIPHFHHLVCCITIDIPEATLNKMQAIVNKFIWNKKKLRLRLTTLEKTLQNGGLAIPNNKKYPLAASLVACLDWWRMSADAIHFWILLIVIFRMYCKEILLCSFKLSCVIIHWVSVLV